MPRKLTVSLFLIFAMSCLARAQATFTVKDELAADPASSIIDPEYNMDMNMVCWQSEDRELWVCMLDPVTHHFVPSNGKGYLVDQDLTPPTFGGWNGPEWLLSQGNTQIVYNQKKGGVRYPGIATQILGGWTSTTLMQYPDALYAMATNNYTDSTGLFLFESLSNDGIRWVSNSDLNDCHFYPDITLGFFADDNQQICCAINHSRQPGFLEVSTTLPFFTKISNDTIGAPFMWNDPETNSRMFMYRTNDNQTLKIFQENSDGNWYLYHSFNSPLPDPYVFITSPEPFVFQGRSYVSFMAAQSPMGMTEMPAEIWMASINPMNPLMRRVSDSSIAVRIDPEPVVIGDSAFIYYTQKIHTRWWYTVHQVRKCNTGLENMYTAVREKSPAVTRQLELYPSPADRYISPLIEAVEGNTSYSILDPSGRIVRSGEFDPNDPRIPVSDLNSGWYLLHLNLKNQTLSGKFLVRH